MSRDEDDPLADWFTTPHSAGDSGLSTGPAADHVPTAAPGRHAGADDPPDEPTGDHGDGWARRRPVVVVGLAAAVLWTAAAVLGATTGGDGPPPVADGPRAQASTAGGLSATVPGDVTAPAPAGSDTHAAPPAASSGARVEAVALVALHDLESRSLPGGASRWIDAAAVEQVRALPEEAGRRPPSAADVEGDAVTAAVVTLRSVVLEGDGDAWTERRRARFALPVACGAEDCRELAAPWALRSDDGTAPVAGATAPTPAPSPTSVPPPSPGGPDAQADPPDGQSDEQSVEIGRALLREGYRAVAVARVVPLWTDVVEVHADARAPGEHRSRAHVVWIDTGGVPFHVLGGARG